MKADGSVGSPGLHRGLGRFDVVALCVNSIVGAGVFALPAMLALDAGRYSLAVIFAAFVTVGFLALSLAEVSSRYDVTGGPQVYEGRDMATAHAGMQITDDEFDRLAGHLEAALDAHDVPEAEKQELFAIVGEPIVRAFQRLVLVRLRDEPTDLPRTLLNRIQCQAPVLIRMAGPLRRAPP